MSPHLGHWFGLALTLVCLLGGASLVATQDVRVEVATYLVPANTPRPAPEVFVPAGPFQMGCGSSMTIVTTMRCHSTLYTWTPTTSTSTR